MIVTAPHYYRTFQCIASECPDTCCAGWSIAIDGPSLKAYRRMESPFGGRLHNSIDWENACFKQSGGRCDLLGEDGLCDLYREAGPEHLCRTCRVYPRHVEEFEGRREWSLCLSCIEAARLILGCGEPVRFLVREDGRQESYGDFNFLLFTKLTDARDWAIGALLDRSSSWTSRLSFCLALAHDLQGCIRRGRLYEADALFRRCAVPGFEARLREKLGSHGADGPDGPGRYGTMRNLYAILTDMEVLKPDWAGFRDEMGGVLYGTGEKSYGEQSRAFQESADLARLPLWMEQLMVYYVSVYFCGAVYDGKPYGKMKAAVACSLLIREMAQAVWEMQGRRLSFMDFVDVAHRFSRETEHSDVNREVLESALTQSPSFGIRRLLGALAGMA